MRNYTKSEAVLSRCRKVLMINQVTNVIINEYDSLQECALENGLEANLISAVCRGKRKSHGGFTFRYKEETK